MAITVEEGMADLVAWLNADAAAIEVVRGLNGGGGWEQWCVIQFLRWQRVNRQNLDYQRELTFRDRQINRRFDIAYNVQQTSRDATHPLILTQWKCGNDGTKVTEEVNIDIGTLVEVPKANEILPVLVILCAGNVQFAGVRSSGAIPNTAVRLYYSTADTWKTYGHFKV